MASKLDGSVIRRIFRINLLAMAELGGILRKLYDEYQVRTPKRLKLIDAYLLYILLTGIIQFVYCVLVGTFPFNSFLSGFISTVASFVLASKCFKDSSVNRISCFLVPERRISTCWMGKLSCLSLCVDFMNFCVCHR